MGGDAAHHLALALGQEQPRFRMLEPGVCARIDQAVHFGLERRDPVRIAPVHRPGEIDEGFRSAASSTGRTMIGEGSGTGEAAITSPIRAMAALKRACLFSTVHALGRPCLPDL
jgi:hypothetical protein